jgi:non-heme chloroperoxidase
MLERMCSSQAEIVCGGDGAQIHCVHAGSGPTVVLAHGYLLETEFFDLVFNELVRSGHRVIAFDQRGHGRSRGGSDGYGSAAAAADYAAVLEHFDARDATLVAQLFGNSPDPTFFELTRAMLVRQDLRLSMPLLQE